MAEPIIHSHSYQHFEDLQLSTKEFYKMLAALIKEYEYPNVKCKIVALEERYGLLNTLLLSNRDYLQISRGKLRYLVCAAPFGRSYFISWWHEQRETDLERFLTKLLGPKKKTRYEVDTELMFNNAIASIVKLAIQKATADKGFRTTEKLLH